MPKSKRARVVHTSKTPKNRKELVKRLYANVQAAADTYDYLWAFDVQNMRNTNLKEVRSQLNDSRIFMGKTKVMVHALGATVETEHAPGLRLLSAHMSGEIGLLCTNKTPGEIRNYFATFTAWDYARAGTPASDAFIIPPGELRTSFGAEGGENDLIPISIEPTLRKLGVPTRIVKGRVVLDDSPGAKQIQCEDVDGYMVCRMNEPLDARQTALLKIFGVRMAEFRVTLKALWTKADGTVTQPDAMDVD